MFNSINNKIWLKKYACLFCCERCLQRGFPIVSSINCYVWLICYICHQTNTLFKPAQCRCMCGDMDGYFRRSTDMHIWVPLHRNMKPLYVSVERRDHLVHTHYYLKCIHLSRRHMKQYKVLRRTQKYKVSMCVNHVP